MGDALLSLDSASLPSVDPRCADALAPVAALSEWRPGLPLYAQLRRGRRRTGVRPDDVRHHQIERLQGAALAILEDQGFAAVSALRVCTLAGVERKVFQYEFGGQGIGAVECARTAIMNVAVEAFARARPGGETGVQRAFTALVRTLCQKTADEKSMRAAFAAHLPHGPEFSADMRQRHRFAQAIGRHLAAGDGGVKLPFTFCCAIAGGVELAIRRKLASGKPVPSDLADQLVRWVLCYRDPAALLLTEDHSGQAPERSRESFQLDTRGRIVEAATQVAVSLGPGALTLERIAQVAELPVATILEKYKTPEACFFGGVQRAGMYALVCSVEAAKKVEDRLASVPPAITTLMHAIAQDPTLVRLLFVELSAFRDGIEHRERLVKRFIDHLRRELPKPVSLADDLADLIGAAGWALVDDHVRNDATSSLPQSANHVSYLVLAPIIGAPQAVEVILSRG